MHVLILFQYQASFWIEYKLKFALHFISIYNHGESKTTIS